MDIMTILWALPVLLAVLAVLQVLRWAWLVYAPITEATVPEKKTGALPAISQRDISSGRSGATQGGLPSMSNATIVDVVGKMVVLSGLPEAREYPLPSNHFAIGRLVNIENNIPIALDEGSVSRRHAIVRCDERTREYFIMDANSSYGTHLIVNNQLRTLDPGKEERIYNQDTIQFGNVVRVRMMIVGETRPTGR